MSRRSKTRVSKTDTVKWRIFSCLLLFSMVVIVFLWIMQVVFLDQFYFRTTKTRLSISSSQLLACPSERIPALSEKIAVNRQLSVAVYKIERQDGKMNVYTLSHVVNSGSIIECLDKDDMNAIYNHVKETDKASVIFNSAELSRLIGDLTAETSEEAPPEYLLSATVKTDPHGNLLYILLDTPLAPLEPTVSTLKLQLGVISVLLFILSVGFAILLSFMIARPLKKLNNAAKDLANGNYQVDFKADGYREVVELSDTLTYAADEIAKVDRLQKELLANISHDLRTPLTMIIGYGEVMRDIEGENTPENVQVIIDEAERLSLLVNDLLEISSYQATGESIARDALNIDETLRDLTLRYQHLKERADYKIRYESNGEAYIYADKKRIVQAVCNLINNAINYAGNDKTVIVSCQKDSEKVRVSVTDHGIGIPEEELKNVWHRYYKVDKNHVRGVMGSGLGLSIVKSIFELHGARYGIDSRVGEGSTFWFELPLYTPPESQLPDMR